MADDVNLGAVANTFIASQLAADNSLVSLVSNRIFADFSLEILAGQNAVYPLIVFTQASALNVLTMGAQRLYANYIYHVMAHGVGGYGAISSAADRIVATLRNCSSIPVIYAGNTYYVDSFCEGEIQPHPDVLPGGQVAYARGSKVRIYVSALS